tara:strand:+ start:1126 stop:2454 length:1329 start_codon:yes stop_codon:yes gene_type:complete
MADIKFSQFTNQTDYINVDEVVGYNGATNVRITPGDLISSYLLDTSLVGFNNSIKLGTVGAGCSIQAGFNGTQDLFFSNSGATNYFRNVAFTQSGDFVVQSIGSGDTLRLNNDPADPNVGQLELSKYGVGTFTGGTPVYNLGVDANGIIKETSLVDANTITGTVASGEIPFATGANVLSSSNEFTFNLTGSTNTLPTIGVGLAGAANTKGAVEIESFLDYNSGAAFDYFLYTAAGGPFLNFAGVGTFAISVHTAGRFMGSGIHIYSDERIKKDISVSDSEKDLETISKIEISNYKHIDQAHGTRVHKKVIAQQVIKHYPEAVAIGKEVVPCIYEKSTIEDGVIKISADSCGSDTCCKLNDKIKLIYPDGSKELVNIIESDGDSIKVDSNKSGDVFVYGKEVDDYHSVDYDALAMLNISATQELYKIIKELKQEIKHLKQNNN